MQSNKSEVAIVYKSLPHYRVAFYNKLRCRLENEGVRLRVLTGQPDPQLARRNDTSALEWMETVRNRYVHVGRRHVVWQPCLRATRSSDLVIVEQASKLLVNYPLLALRRFGGPKVAWWGHGINLDRDAASPFAEAVKRKLAAQADWWFCYTQGTADLVASLGVPPNRMTVVQNAIDTEGLREMRSALTAEKVKEIRRELGIGDGPVAVYIGSLYPAKRPNFLLEAADHVRKQVDGFELIVIGDGPERDLLEVAATSRAWLQVLGHRRGADLVRLASPASVVLNPGLVGLAVLDAFALGLPMVTCDLPYHSPEIDYLEHDVNGLVLPSRTTWYEYATEVAKLLLDSERLSRLSDGAEAAAQRYTLQEMVDRFADGIRGVLGLSA